MVAAVILFAMLLAASWTGTSKAMSIKVQKINFDVDSDYLKIDGKLRSENGENVVDIAMDLLKDISDPVYIESEIFTRIEGESSYISFLKGSPIDICKFFENPTLNPFLGMIMSKLNDYGNKMTSCPIHKMKYNIVGFRMDPKTLPSFVPVGDYRMEIRVTRLVNGDYKKVYIFDCDTRIEH